MRISDWSSDVCSSDLGKALIRRYEDAGAPDHLKSAYRAYALGLAHTHLPAMRVHAGLAHSPLFVPAVGTYYQGMLVQVPLQLWALPATPKPGDLRDALADHYARQHYLSVTTAETRKRVRSGKGLSERV